MKHQILALQQLNTELIQIIETEDPGGKWEKELSRHFMEEEMQMASRHMDRVSTPLVIRKIEVTYKTEIGPQT